MSGTKLKLLCLAWPDDNPHENIVEVDIDGDDTVAGLKKIIKHEHAHAFAHVDARNLVVWKCFIHVDKDLQKNLETIDFKLPRRRLHRLPPASEVSEHFAAGLPRKTIHILVEVPALENVTGRRNPGRKARGGGSRDNDKYQQSEEEEEDDNGTAYEVEGQQGKKKNVNMTETEEETEEENDENRDVNQKQVETDGSSNGTKQDENEELLNRGSKRKSSETEPLGVNPHGAYTPCRKANRVCVPRKMGFSCQWCNGRKKKCDHTNFKAREEDRERKKEEEMERQKKQKMKKVDNRQKPAAPQTKQNASGQKLTAAPQASTNRGTLVGLPSNEAKLKKSKENTKEIKEEIAVIRGLALGLVSAVKRIEEKMEMNTDE